LSANNMTDRQTDQQTCVDCGQQSASGTDYTLIGSGNGWRFARVPAADGRIEVQWRCPSCWREYKERRQSVPPAGEPGSLLDRIRRLLPWKGE
jgi:hypothetical protein